MSPTPHTFPHPPRESPAMQRDAGDRERRGLSVSLHYNRVCINALDRVIRGNRSSARRTVTQKNKRPALRVVESPVASSVRLFNQPRTFRCSSVSRSGARDFLKTSENMSESTTLALPSGHRMPIVGFGTWQASDEELVNAIDNALEAGYRHIDCAPVYMNEHVIGKVLKKWFDSGKIKREDLFIVTKLPPSGNRPESVEKYLKKSLKDLQIEYLDLYLIHTPFAFVEENDDLHPKDENGQIKIDTSTDHLAVWAEMEKQVVNGLTKAIGLSNFNSKQIDRVLNAAKVPVSMLQIELHLYFQQQEMVEYCKNKDVPITAYSPLGTRGLVKLLGKSDTLPDLLENPTVLEIAKKHNKTPAQIALKHTIQKGIAVIPKSTTPQRIKDNIQLFGWKLDSEDVSALNKLDQGSKGRICDFTFLPGTEKHPEFPF